MSPCHPAPLGGRSPLVGAAHVAHPAAAELRQYLVWKRRHTRGSAVAGPAMP